MPAIDNITCTTGGVTVYRPGDYVEGTWTVTIKEPAKVRWVDVEFHGATFVKWSEVEFRAPDKNFITHEEYVNSWKRVVMHSGKRINLNMSLVVFMHYYLQKNEIAHSHNSLNLSWFLYMSVFVSKCPLVKVTWDNKPTKCNVKWFNDPSRKQLHCGGSRTANAMHLLFTVYIATCHYRGSQLLSLSHV